MTTDYLQRLARDLRLAYGDLDDLEFMKVVTEFEAETERVLRERAAFVALSTPQAVALLMVLYEVAEALKFYRERGRQ